MSALYKIDKDDNVDFQIFNLVRYGYSEDIVAYIQQLRFERLKRDAMYWSDIVNVAPYYEYEAHSASEKDYKTWIEQATRIANAYATRVAKMQEKLDAKQ